MSKKEENLYMEAKRAYYQGDPIMSDFEFDALEEKLKSIGSNVVNIVGSDAEVEKCHLSPMLSLEKIQVLDESKLPIAEVLDWAPSDSDKLEVTPKLDGSSCNLIYHNGKLVEAITRGNGKAGTDILNKMKYIVPASIESLENVDSIEVRGEVVINEQLFNKKYGADYKNPRNFVAGILGRKDEFDAVKDFHFIAFEVKLHYQGDCTPHTNSIQFLQSNNFKVPANIKYFSAHQFKEMYDEMLDFRMNRSEYQLDGFVLKINESKRSELGEGTKAPKWAMAIKFPPTEAHTVVNDIEWRVGMSGEFTPVGIIQPVELAGTTVSRVSLHNLGNCRENGIWPGAKVVIVKSGDIIPMVKRVIEGSIENPTYLPPPCSPSCNIVEHGIHLMCDNPNCPEKSISKLNGGIGSLGMKGIGGAIVEKLNAAGISSIVDIFDKSKFNKTKLIQSGHFVEGRSLDLVFENFKKRDVLTLDKVIRSLCFLNVGSRMSIAIAKIIQGQEVDLSGFNKEIIHRFYNENSYERKEISRFLKVLKDNGYEVEIPKVQTGETIKIEMTGSPKPLYDNKNELLKDDFILPIEHFGLKPGVQYLITDDPTSTSSKMKKAAKLGVEVITYEDFKNKFHK